MNYIADNCYSTLWESGNTSQQRIEAIQQTGCPYALARLAVITANAVRCHGGILRNELSLDCIVSTEEHKNGASLEMLQLGILVHRGKFPKRMKKEELLPQLHEAAKRAGLYGLSPG